MNNIYSLKRVSLARRITGWSIHLFTASGACVGLMSLLAIYQHNVLQALWFMIAAILIDAVDGMFARAIRIKEAVPEVDGALLDNIVDFVNYTIVPCFFLLVTDVVPEQFRVFCAMAIALSSCYQFTQVDAKTKDNFFKGFPSYWNITVFYLFFWQMNSFTNMGVLLVLCVLSFVPIKYVYPSRMDYLTESTLLRRGMVVSTVLWGVVTATLLWLYPATNHFLVYLSLTYLLLYFGISLYRTWVPLPSLAMSQD